MNEEARQLDSDSSVLPRKKRRIWRIHFSTFVIALLASVLLVLMMVPGPRSHYFRVEMGGFSGSDLEAVEPGNTVTFRLSIHTAKLRFHGWPAIHLVTFENYELFDSELSPMGHKVKNETVLFGGPVPKLGLTIPKGDKTNQELALKIVDEAYDEYELNHRFWAQPAEVNYDAPDMSFFIPGTSKYPIWMNADNWTMGMKHKVQWQALAVNLLLALAILIAVVVVVEFRRRRRSSVWQISLLEIGMLITLASLAAWFFSNKRHAETFVANLQAKGVVDQTYTVADPVWMARIIGPSFCTQYGNLTLDLSRVNEEDREQLGYLRYTDPWMFHLKSFGMEDTSVVEHVPGTSILWLTLNKSPDAIQWDKVSFGSKLENLMVYSFDAEEKSIARINSRLTRKSASSFNYPPIAFDPFEAAALRTGNFEQVTVSGFEIDREFIQRLAACRQIGSLDLAVSRVTDGAFDELMKMRKLEKLSAKCTSNLTDEQVKQLSSRHGDF